MTRFPDTPEISAYRPYDAAPAALIDDVIRIRAQARKEQIMSAPTSFVAHRAVSRRALRLAAIPVAAAAALGVSIIWPHSPMVPPAQASLLSWTAVAEPLDGALLAETDAACRAAMGGETIGSIAGDLLVRIDAPPVVAEQREDWATLVYEVDNAGLICLSWMGGEQPEPNMWEAPSAAVFDGSKEPSMWKYARSTLSGPMPDSVRVEVAGVTPERGIEFKFGSSFEFTDGTAFTAQVGRVSPDVESLTLHTLTGGDVEATIGNGWFVAWWPGPLGGPSLYWGPLTDENGTPSDDAPLQYDRWKGSEPISGYTVTNVEGNVTTVEANWPWFECPAGYCVYEVPEDALVSDWR